MMAPLVVMYILANIIFQMAVKNSSPESLNCIECWNYTKHSSDHVKYFNAFQLMHWYYNPVLWVFVLCFCQALSHSFERKWIIFSSINIRKKEMFSILQHGEKKTSDSVSYSNLLFPTYQVGLWTQVKMWVSVVFSLPLYCLFHIVLWSKVR